MIKKLSLVLSLALVLVLFAGCAAEKKLDRMEDRAEAFVENKEEQAEQYIASMVEGQRGSTENAPNTVTGESLQSTLPENAVTKDLAENIALEYVGLTREQVSGLRTEYEIDDGIPQYDVEFYKDGQEYEFEIHGETGAIVSFHKD